MSEKKKVEGSRFLRESKPALKHLHGILLWKYGYASKLAVDSEAKIYSVAASGINIGDFGMLCNRGFVIKVYNEGEYAEYSFNKLENDVNMQAVSFVEEIEKLKKAVPDCVEKIKLAKLNDEPVSFARVISCDISLSCRVDVSGCLPHTPFLMQPLFPAVC